MPQSSPHNKGLYPPKITFFRNKNNKQKKVNILICEISEPSSEGTVLSALCLQNVSTQVTFCSSWFFHCTIFPNWRPFLSLAHRSSIIIFSMSFSLSMPTQKYLQEKNPSTVQSATTPAQQLVTSRNTCCYIQEEILSVLHTSWSPKDTLAHPFRR